MCVTLFALKFPCLGTMFMIRHNEIKYRTNLMAFEKKFVNFHKPFDAILDVIGIY